MSRKIFTDIQGCNAFIENKGQCSLPIEERCAELTDGGAKTKRVLVGYCWKHRHSIPVCKNCNKAVRNPEHEEKCKLNQSQQSATKGMLNQ